MAAHPICTTAEVWKPCPNFEGIYAVSSHGRVKRTAPGAGKAKVGHILATARNAKGYHYLNLCRNGKMQTTYVHTLVCRTFHGEKPTPSHQAAHRDDNKDENTEANLYWATGLENHADRRRNGLIPTGSKVRISKLTEEQIPAIRAMLAAGHTQRAVAELFGVGCTTIHSVSSGRTWGQVR